MVFISLRYGGLILIITAFILTVFYYQRRLKTKEYKAVIVSVKKRVVRTGKQVYTLYIPMIAYQVGDKRYQKEGPSAQGESVYQLGQSLMIQINPKNPEKFIISGKNHDALNIIHIFSLGLMLVVLSFIIY